MIAAQWPSTRQALAPDRASTATGHKVNKQRSGADEHQEPCHKPADPFERPDQEGMAVGVEFLHACDIAPIERSLIGQRMMPTPKASMMAPTVTFIRRPFSSVFVATHQLWRMQMRLGSIVGYRGAPNWVLR
ncbi:hypothetical protein [Sphingomonas yabuuchiae]|uniref:hypothetical protein n=1 Tax=Sphingomonas yabuuchiae TaxID=172044 RepID=UPI00360C6F2C